MKSKKITLLILLIASYSIVAQQKITLEEIWTGAFRTKGMDELHALKNTNQYTVLDFDRASRSMQIDLYDFETLEKVTTLINTKDFPELESIDTYTFDQSETKILLATHSSPIFRHSFTADYFVYDTKTKALHKFTNNAIQEPTFSSDGSKIAYAFENNLYVYDTTSKTNLQITQDGQKNKIINGITDWVYEEEFAFVKAFDWNKTGENSRLDSEWEGRYDEYDPMYPGNKKGGTPSEYSRMTGLSIQLFYYLGRYDKKDSK